MGLSTLPSLTGQLSSHGFDLDTPAVAVERGTTVDQRVVYGTLRELHAAVTVARLKSPTLIIIGQVVALAPGWQVNRQEAVQPGVDCSAWQGQCARQLLPDVVEAVLTSSSSSSKQVAVPAAAAAAGVAMQVPNAGAAERTCSDVCAV
jgi:hypothetical protein